MKRFDYFRAKSWGMGLLALCWASAAIATDALVRVAGDTMGTRFQVSVRNARSTAGQLQAGVQAQLDAVDAAMSTWRADSELSRLNAAVSTDWIPVSPELFTVLQAAAEISAATAGAFDVTLGPVVNLWGFGPRAQPPTPPPPAALDAARARVGYRLLTLATEPPRVRKARADVYVDLSAIAKGHAVDRVAEWLEERGASDYLVEVGGEIRGAGTAADGRAWRIGVAWPARDTDDIERVIPLRDIALATSGDYRHYFDYAGRRYSHEIDPTTGSPITHRLASVTVLHSSCMHADALATGLLVLGPERGPALARRLGLGALFLVRTADGYDAIRTGDFPTALAQHR